MSDFSQLQLFSDTDPKTESVLITLLREKQPSEKLRMVDQLNASLHILTLSGLRERYPKANEKELKFRLAQLLFGDEVAQKISPKIKNSY
jgi:hypothetical protein